VNDNVVPIRPPHWTDDSDPGNITGKYILVDRVPVAEPDLFKWGSWIEKADRHVAKTDVDGVSVSTVFMGLDHSWGSGPPLLFETMIFGGEHDEGYQERCSTWDEAVAMHATAVKVARRGKKVPSAEWASRIVNKRLRAFFKKLK